MAKAELIVDYGANQFPASAKCSLCGEEMSQSEPRLASIGETIQWFAGQFTAQMEQKHPSEMNWRSPARTRI
jgi:hypothetical protein